MLRRFAALIGLGALAPLATADVLTLNPTADARILDISPESNFGADILSTYNMPGNEQRTVLQFDLGALPADSVVHGAVLRLYGQSLGSLSPTSISAYRVGQPWVENQTTWNLAATGSPWTHVGGDFYGAGGAHLADPYGTWSGPQVNFPSWYEVPVTSLIAAFAAGTVPNYGIGLASPLDCNLVFVQSEATAGSIPELVIEYHVVPEPHSAWLLLALVLARRTRHG